ncbi:tether containing UBX domain for GLUT4 [Elysia marginata]|uniref:Tether containing UBX domain for GLUT4 n=1 Tax=Elysia marginata TaxID=1093978 RepID=A0AAV4ITE5_9GAST|nr:tether containing UBX domain for GLUT4 [Elysia marginata]
MAASVQVLCPNGRRQNVKINPNTKLLQILEEVCQRQGFVPPEDYKLVQGRKEFDLSLSVRYASLPNNAKLEMVKSPSSRTEQDVVIALQLASGERYQESFKPSSSLWDILLVFESKISHLKDVLTQVDTCHIPALHPVCIYMREEVVGEQALKATTLKKLALTSGKAIIRHLHRSIDEGTLGAIVDKVEKEKQKQAKLEEIALKKNELCHMDEQQKMKEVSLAAANSADLSATTVQSMDVDEQSSGSVEPTTGHSEPTLQESSMDKQVIPNSGVTDPSPVRQQQHSSAIDDLRNLNIPGVQVFTPDDFSDLSPQEQAIAQRLAARFLPHLQAMADPTQPVDVQPDSRQESRQSHVPSSFENFKFPESTRGMNLQNNKRERSVLESACNRDPILFDGNEVLESEMNSQDDDVPDDFFDVTKNDVKMMYRDLQNAVRQFEDQPLLTTAMRNERMESMFDNYDRIVIRVQFPDRSILQGLFRPREPLAALRSFVRENIENKDDKFYLYTAPPKEVLKDDTTSLAVSKLAPAALVYYGCETQRDVYVSSTLRGNMKPRVEADLVVSEMELYLISILFFILTIYSSLRNPSAEVVKTRKKVKNDLTRRSEFAFSFPQPLHSL